MPTTQRRVIFLLGAGTSVPAGMPSTQQITDQVLSGDKVVHDSYSQYRILADDDPGSYVDPRIDDHLRKVHVLPVVEHLRLLADLARDYFFQKRRGRAANYEDVYYLAVQVRDICVGVLDNPLIYEVSKEIFKQTTRHEYERSRGSSAGPSPSPRTIQQNATDYIERVIACMLDRIPTRTDHLGLIAQAWQDAVVSHLSVATLNHDRVIDSFLAERSIPYVDGFADPTEAKDGFRCFQPEVYNRPQRVVRVLKLHGSVGWCVLFRPDDLWDQKIVVVTDPCIMDRLRLQGYQLGPLAIQIGTCNKVENYTLYHHLSQLQCRFLRCLDDSDVMVISGYSFGDTGVNARIDAWVTGSRGRRLVVVDPRPDSAERGLWGHWKTWVSCGVAHAIPRCIETVTWDEVRKVISDSHS
jgi:hypothetical protein